MPSQLREEAETIAAAWGDTAWLRDCKLEYSTRLTRNLGTTYPERNLIRLHQALANREELRRTVLCHELAHLLTYRRHGRDVAPHGPEWEGLVIQADGDPAVRLVAEDLTSTRSPRQPRRYRHVCPVCQNVRLAKRRVTRWRCPECVAQGLDGRLIIEEVA